MAANDDEDGEAKGDGGEQQPRQSGRDTEREEDAP